MCAASSTSGKLNAILLNSFAVTLRDCVSIELELPKVKEKRQAACDTNQQRPNDGQPEKLHFHSTTFGKNKNHQHDCGHNHVPSEEPADAVREQIMDEEREIQAMLAEPGQKLAVGQERSD
jgi:hypothetical protein